jgi:hypothetical protein
MGRERTRASLPRDGPDRGEVLLPGGGGWGARIRTWECRYQKPMPYRLATPQQFLTLTKWAVAALVVLLAGMGYFLT